MINVLISPAEYVHQEHFIPLDVNSSDGRVIAADEKSEEFRPAALYTHPLTGAMATAFGLFLAIQTKLRFRTAAICVGTFAVGSWLRWPGGAGRYDRIDCGAGGNHVGTGLPQRPDQRPAVGNDLDGSVPPRSPDDIPVLETPVGERIAARAYYDDSAEVSPISGRFSVRSTPTKLCMEPRPLIWR